MTQQKIHFLEKTFFNLSITKKWLLVAVIAGLMLVIKIVAMNAFISSAANSNAAQLATTFSNYALWSNIIFYVAIIGLLYAAFWMFKKQLHSVNSGLSTAIANGTLDANASFCSTDELGELARMVCLETGNIQHIGSHQEQVIQELEGHIEPLMTCMEIVNESIEEEFEQIELLATAMNQMTSTVKEIANNAGSASSSTTEAAEVAQEGSQFVDATIATINSLSSNIGASADAVTSVEVKVEGIGSVVDTIRSISDQTNLLALNAAIEAARAGEAGRGFAVVADEVRNLAKRTQESTVEIQGMIEQLQTSAEDAVSLMGKSVQEADVGVDQVTKAGTQLAGIVEKVHHISDMNYQIASSADEQTTVAGEINIKLDQVKELVEGSVVVLKEITEMAAMMNNQIEALSKMTRH